MPFLACFSFVLHLCQMLAFFCATLRCQLMFGMQTCGKPLLASQNCTQIAQIASILRVHVAYPCIIFPPWTPLWTLLHNSGPFLGLFFECWLDIWRNGTNEFKIQKYRLLKYRFVLLSTPIWKSKRTVLVLLVAHNYRKKPTKFGLTKTPKKGWGLCKGMKARKVLFWSTNLVPTHANSNCPFLHCQQS